ncbi:MAG: hypothetical protein ACI89Z_000711 [Porticoccus sp.]|jgi:hypothetical protein
MAAAVTTIESYIDDDVKAKASQKLKHWLVWLKDVTPDKFVSFFINALKRVV